MCDRYFSPYPLTESEVDDGPLPADVTPRIAGVARATVRSHGRTSDLLAGGLGREHASGARSVLWVCDRCFKYMAEGTSWEAHVVRPRFARQRVYVEGCWADADGCAVSAGARASIRREGRCISGVRILFGRSMGRRRRYVRCCLQSLVVLRIAFQLYCQNLSLFGKFFIDIKTLFFDCDNCAYKSYVCICSVSHAVDPVLFYILTDADSQRDHVLGFFSKVEHPTLIAAL